MKLITDPDLCDALGRRARQRFEQHFTWRAIAAQHDKLYRELKAG
jgi:glycosyltransferase involved in cell wall biosynthesis